MHIQVCIYMCMFYSPVLATSQGSTIMSPAMNLNVSERDMNIGSCLAIRPWADAANRMKVQENSNIKYKISRIGLKYQLNDSKYYYPTSTRHALYVYGYQHKPSSSSSVA